MYQMSEVIFWLSVGGFVIAVIYLVSRPSIPFPQSLTTEQPAGVKLSVSVAGIALLLILVSGGINIATEKSAARQKAVQHLTQEYVVSSQEVHLGPSVCLTSEWYSCQTWKAPYSVKTGGQTYGGYIIFDPGNAFIEE